MDIWNEVTLFALLLIGRIREVVSQDETSGAIQATTEKDGSRSKCQTRING